MAHDVIVNQLRTPGHGVSGNRMFMNVDVGIDKLGVSTSIHEIPTYLVRARSTVYFIQFATEELFKEWMNGMVQYGFTWTKIEDLEEVTYDRTQGT